MLEKAPIIATYETTTRPLSRLRRGFVVIIALLALVHLCSKFRYNVDPAFSSDDIYIDAATSDKTMHLYHQTVWTHMVDLLEHGRPTLPSALKTAFAVPRIPIHSSPSPRQRFDAIHINTTILASLSNAHSQFEDQLHESKIGSSLIYRPNTRGIIVTADRSDLPSVLVQLRMLRRTNTFLPVQIFLLDKDAYDEDLCQGAFIKLQAQCRILSTLMDKKQLPSLHLLDHPSIRSRSIKANETLFKLLALLFSDFEDNLLLDATTLVYNKPNSIFVEEPYLSKGIIMWPHLWTSSISPRMDLIQKQTVLNRVSADRSSTVDMSQVLLSKSLQGDTLLLAIYYATFGPGLYDVLLRQSEEGEERGSQAIKAAARHLHHPFYMVKNKMQLMGYFTHSIDDQGERNRQFHQMATLQHAAVSDYHRRPANQHTPLFIHASNMSLNPLTIMTSGAVPGTRKPLGLNSGFGGAGGGRRAKAASSNRKGASIASLRMWQIFTARHTSNGWDDTDPEHALWEEMANVACVDLQGIPSYKMRARQACSDIQKHVDRFE